MLVKRVENGNTHWVFSLPCKSLGQMGYGSEMRNWSAKKVRSHHSSRYWKKNIIVHRCSILWKWRLIKHPAFCRTWLLNLVGDASGKTWSCLGGEIPKQKLPWFPWLWIEQGYNKDVCHRFGISFLSWGFCFVIHGFQGPSDPSQHHQFQCCHQQLRKGWETAATWSIEHQPW